MQFLNQYLIFFAKFITIFLGIIGILLMIGLLVNKSKGKNQGKLTVRKLNDIYEGYRDTFSTIVNSKHELKNWLKEKKKKYKQSNQSKLSEPIKSKFYVINFEGDIRASAVESLREEITAILSFAKSTDQVLIKINSGGGVVPGYGLAASQLERIKNAKIKLLVSIDKIAASGGYMMACVADHIIAAPFAIVGSIGVIAQIPNFHRYLQKKSIDFEQVMAGNFKRTLTMFGENTEKGREKLQQEVDETHVLFKEFIQLNRQQVPIEKVATGEHWYAVKAIEYKLVDELKTSDDFLLSISKDYDVYEVCYKTKQSLVHRLSKGVSTTFQSVKESLFYYE